MSRVVTTCCRKCGLQNTPSLFLSDSSPACMEGDECVGLHGVYGLTDVKSENSWERRVG